MKDISEGKNTPVILTIMFADSAILLHDGIPYNYI